MDTRTRRYPDLPPDIRRQVAAVEPAGPETSPYYPCAVVLTDGSVHERAIIQHAQSYILGWSVWPEGDRGQHSIDIRRVATVRESRDRVPARFAEMICQSGESGMGYAVFTLVFRHRTALVLQRSIRQTYVTGNVVDFVTYPPGRSGADIVSVVPHADRRDAIEETTPVMSCLYGSGTAPSRMPSQRTP